MQKRLKNNLTDEQLKAGAIILWQEARKVSDLYNSDIFDFMEVVVEELEQRGYIITEMTETLEFKKIEE